jgi:hypothetical protein
MIERSGDIVCGLHRAEGDEEHMFLGLASKPRSTGFPIWASKAVGMVWWFGSQNHYDTFLVWASKSSGLRFIGCATKLTDDEDGVEHASRSSVLFRLEVSRDMVSQSGIKTGGGTTRMVHVPSSRRLRWVEAEHERVNTTSCIGPLYPNFVVLYVLSLRGIVVFCLVL